MDEDACMVFRGGFTYSELGYVSSAEWMIFEIFVGWKVGLYESSARMYTGHVEIV